MAFGLFARGMAAAAFVALPVSAGFAQTPAEFYKGKNVDLYIGYTVGGGYDVYARLVARHMGKHIPGNPNVTPKNMEGAASMRLANWLYNAGPKDGSAFGIVSRGIAFDPLLGHKGAQFDATKYQWIGSANDEVSVCVAWENAGVSKFDELLTKELTIGSTGTADDTYQFPRVINGVLGTKMKMITGYPGGNDISLAMERGEVAGRCGWSWSSVISTRPNWLKEKKIIVLVQAALNKHPDLPDVPLVMDYAKTEEQQQILKLIFARGVMGRPFMAAPEVPQDRVAALRKAFMDTMHDKDFLADAERAKLEITPVEGEKLDQLVKDIYKTPAAIAAKAGDLLK
jgi:tripartite-type tricarboxylate transporter receptor subunit TctC